MPSFYSDLDVSLWPKGSRQKCFCQWSGNQPSISSPPSSSYSDFLTFFIHNLELYLQTLLWTDDNSIQHSEIQTPVYHIWTVVKLRPGNKIKVQKCVSLLYCSMSNFQKDSKVCGLSDQRRLNQKIYDQYFIIYIQI